MRKTHLALSVLILGLAAAAAGIHAGEIDDAPGAALLGLVLLLVAVVLAAKIVRRTP